MGCRLTLSRQHWPELLPEGPPGPTPSASGFHAAHRRTGTCVPAKEGEALPGTSSDAKSTEGMSLERDVSLSG